VRLPPFVRLNSASSGAGMQERRDSKKGRGGGRGRGEREASELELELAEALNLSRSKPRDVCVLFTNWRRGLAGDI
jgi:hypothetical protein